MAAPMEIAPKMTPDLKIRSYTRSLLPMAMG
jgi:hypothetical protein